MEAKDHNLSEVDRCNQLFEVKYQTIQRLNEQIRTALNAETQKRIGKSIFERAVSLHTAVLFLILGLWRVYSANFVYLKIEEIKRDNIFQIDFAREKYLTYYKRDMEYNETVSKILKQTAEIREQVWCIAEPALRCWFISQYDR